MTAIFPHLRRMALFRCLSDTQLADYAEPWAWFSVPSGATLVRQGETADALYIVITGVMAVVVRDGAGHGRQVAWAGAGEVIGEIGVLTGEVRSADVIALRDTSVVQLSSTEFHDLTEREPEILRNFTRQLSRRLSRTSHRRIRPMPTRVLAVLPLNGAAPARELAEDLSQRLQEGLTLPLQFPELQSPNVANSSTRQRVAVVSHEAQSRSEAWFSELESAHDLVICVGDAAHPNWSKFCWRQADHVLLVTRPNTPPDTTTGTLVQRRDVVRRPVDLVVIQPDSATMPAPASPECATFDSDLRIHVRMGCGDDKARLARIATNSAIGLVLSGGGARGYAHIGVVRALREFGLPIDLVGGTSFGAIVAAGIAYGWSDADLYAHFEAAFGHDPPVNDYTLPLVSLIKGHKVDRRLQRHFGDALIENLWRPYFCTSANLTTGTLCRHLDGPVVKSVRASVAIPGLLPPVSQGRELLADGAILNNLPVDIMNDWGRGPVIAVDVAQDRALSAEFDDIENASFWSLFRRRSRKTPGIVSLLIRAATLSGDINTAESKSQASWLITPTLTDFSLQDWAAFSECITAGYQHTATLLEKRRKTGIPDPGGIAFDWL